MSYVKRFNPYDLPEETLLAIATGREKVLEDILATITRNAEGGAVQHLQIVAPRGYGKSFLMRLVQSAVKAKAAQGLPVVLALLPEEQHNVDAPHRLLNEIQRVLEGRPAGDLLGSAFTRSDEAWGPALAELDAAIAAKLPEGRGVAVAVVENFDQLMDDVFSEPRDQSRLRALLARKGGRLMLLATATRRADADYDERLFHATRLIELDPWREESCLTFFERLRGQQRHEGPMRPEIRAKAQAIAQFIGGSPRMATVLAQVLDSNDSLKAAEILDALVDELTPYYKHRIESLSRRARTLLDALLRMGEPRTQSEIAARLGVPQARIAEPFNELRAHGEVTGVKAQRSAEMLYRVSDRLMAHYYRKRHLSSGESASLLEGITELLVGFFSPEEKRAEAERLRALGRAADAAVLERLMAAELARAGSARSEREIEGSWLDEVWARLGTLVGTGALAEAVALAQQAVERAATSGDWLEQAISRRYFGWILVESNCHAEAEQVFRQALDLAGKAASHDELAESARSLGWVLAHLGRYAEAEEKLRDAVAIAALIDDLWLHTKASGSLGWVLARTEQFAEAEETLRRAITLAEKVGDLVEQSVCSRLLGFSLAGMERHLDAVDALRDAVKLAEKVGAHDEIARAACVLLDLASAVKDDVTALMAWQRAVAAAVAAPAKNKDMPNVWLWFHDAAVVALRSSQFEAVWRSAAVLPKSNDDTSVPLAQHRLAELVTDVSDEQGRSAAYELAAQCIEVLAQDAALRSTRNDAAGLEAIAFLRGVLATLAESVTDPALLGDIAGLLKRRLPAETAAERALLEAAALRLEKPDDPAALERVDPDVATALERIRGPSPKPAPKAPSRRKRGSTPKRRK